MLALALALATGVPAEAPAVRVQARRELPWVVAVAAFAIDVTRATLATAISTSRATLDDVGAAARVELLAGHAVMVVEGPPEAHDTIVSAVRGMAITALAAESPPPRSAARGAPFVLFVDGRTVLTDQGALPVRSSSAGSVSTASTAPGATHRTASPAPSLMLPLVPTAGLLDMEGEALALLVETALPADVVVVAAHEEAVLLVNGAMPDVDKARAALQALVEAPLSTNVVEDLRTRARGRIAERRARAGGWARDMATVWLAFGTIEIDEPTDLGSALRARVFPDVLTR